MNFFTSEQFQARFLDGKEPETCGDCKFVGTYRRPRVVAETGFGDQLEFRAKGDVGLAPDDDGDETVYQCHASPVETSNAGTERLVPLRREVVTVGMMLSGDTPGKCTGWVSAAAVDAAELARRAERTAELDRLMARSAERAEMEKK